MGPDWAFTMARYYPSSVRSIVHDGPDLPEDQEVVEDFRGTEVVLNLFSKCAGDATCSSGFPPATEPISSCDSQAQTGATIDRSSAFGIDVIMFYSIRKFEML